MQKVSVFSDVSCIPQTTSPGLGVHHFILGLHRASVAYTIYFSTDYINTIQPTFMRGTAEREVLAITMRVL